MNDMRDTATPIGAAREALPGQGPGSAQPPRERRRLGLRYGAGADAKGARP